MISLPTSRSLNRLRRRPIPPPLRLVGGLALSIAIGTGLLLIPLSSTRPLSFMEALFTATSALSVTGLSIITPVQDLSFIGQILLMLLIQIGGVGFMVVAVIIFRLLGRRISFTDRLALSDSLGLLSPAAILSLTKRVLITVITIEAIGAAMLYLHWRTDPRLSEGQALFYALFHSVSAFCNAGFDLFIGTPGFADGLPRDSVTLFVMGALIFLGGLGIPVVADLTSYFQGHKFSLHTRITLLVVTILVVGGSVGLWLSEGFDTDGALHNEPLARQIIVTTFQSISARTAGFSGIANFEELTPGSQLLLITLMFIGCAPASMGGGITTGTFAVLSISLWSYARGLPTAQFSGRSLATGMVRRAAAVLTISLFVVLLATWLIVTTHDTTLDRAVFEVVSAFATCGLSLGLTDELNPIGQLVIIAVMFWGRLGALTIISAIARPNTSPQHVIYPEEQILIG
ncbi:potassium transporter TrkG [uncultured Chloroflexus sp.]|uniref:TrkH family potassium uptake protein n=1 Tax=uncultured Chloroflexus sp. TaxID=214040 RepID=UPI00262CEB41|nr:potassium transporter TrkG [uncultured Chloroflexus sp.]